MSEKTTNRAEVIAAMENSQMRRLRVASGRIVERMNRTDIGASLAIVLLRVYYRGDDAEPALIADDTGIPRQTITSILDKLERLNLLARVNHASDRRRKNLVLTPEGEAKAIEIWNLINEYEQRVLSVLTEEELTEFNRIHDKIFSSMLAQQD